MPESQEFGQEGAINKLKGQHRKTAYAITFNIQDLAKKYSVERLGFLTLTFAETVLTFKEAQKRYHSFLTHELKGRFEKIIRIGERSPRGRIHYHLLVVTAEDIRTGIDFGEIERGNYRSANVAIRSLWRFLRETAPKYGFGRTELLPVKSTAEGVAKYVGKYIGKGISNRVNCDKGARVVGYSGFGPGERAATGVFNFHSPGSVERHRKLKRFAEELIGVKSMREIREIYGPRWMWFFQDTIMRIDEILERKPLNLPKPEIKEWVGIPAKDKRHISPDHLEKAKSRPAMKQAEEQWRAALKLWQDLDFSRDSDAKPSARAGLKRYEQGAFGGGRDEPSGGPRGEQSVPVPRHHTLKANGGNPEIQLEICDGSQKQRQPNKVGSLCASCGEHTGPRSGAASSRATEPALCASQLKEEIL